MAKQAELPTLERPQDDELDRLVANYLAKAQAHGKSTAAMTSARAELDAELQKAHEEKRLEQTPGKEPVYVYMGGDKPWAARLKDKGSELKVEPLSDKNDPAAKIG